MKVYVVMGNDYPSHVFRRKSSADGFVADAEAREKRELVDLPPALRSRPRIYWRSYEFDLQED